ncbi:MAG: hypothetical protein ABI581_05140 [Sediminibacterium sp.]
MQKLLILSCLLVMTACTKTTSHTLTPKGFFKNPEEAFNIVQKQITKFSPGEVLQTIESISYTYAGNSVYAFIFYRSDKGMDNLAIRKDFKDEELVGGSVTKCEGESCDCLVRVVIGNDGHVDVGCSCPTCKRIISEGL